jgi:hypothetical protein
MREMYELVCMKCGNRSFEDEFVEYCKRVVQSLDRKSICNGRNKIMSVMVRS